MLTSAALGAAAATAFRPSPARAQQESGDTGTSVSYSTRGAEVNGELAIEEDGSHGIQSLSSRTGWSAEPQMRVRLSRAAPDHSGAKHFLILPYQFGIALEYPGVVESWVTDWSIHGRGEAGARLWVGNHDDTGGMLLSATRNSGVRFGEITAQQFSGESGGDLRFTVRDAVDSFEFRSGPIGQERTTFTVTSDGRLVARDDSDDAIEIGARGNAGRAGITFGRTGELRLYPDGNGALRTDSLLVAGGGLGLASVQSAQRVGKVTAKVKVFDADGRELGYVAIHQDR